MKPKKNGFDPFKSPEKYWQGKIAASKDIDHGPAKGTASEDAWLELLRRYFPTRYKVESGFVISADGEKSDQIDCIVYDGTFTPTFFTEHNQSHVPAEAVYAVFEIKQSVTSSEIKYASEKAESVRMLHRTSAPYTGDGKSRPPKPHFPIIAGLLARKIDAKKWDTPISHLREIRDSQPTNKWLDIVLTTEDGGVDYLSDEAIGSASPKIYSKKGGLMFGILRVVRTMVKQGTVPAVNWDEWLSKYKP